jgi:hypothetical protein
MHSDFVKGLISPDCIIWLHAWIIDSLNNKNEIASVGLLGQQLFGGPWSGP